MVDIQHASISETYLHNPKGFSTAGINTVPYKNSGGTLEWINPQEISPSSIHGFAYVENNASPPTSVTTGVLVEFGGTWVSGDFEDVALSGNEFIINTAGDYQVDTHFSLEAGGGGGSAGIYQVVVNVKPSGGAYATDLATAQAAGTVSRGNLVRDVTGGSTGAWGWTGMLTGLAVGDALQLYVQDRVTARSFTITDATLRAVLNKAT